MHMEGWAFYRHSVLAVLFHALWLTGVIDFSSGMRGWHLSDYVLSLVKDDRPPFLSYHVWSLVKQTRHLHHPFQIICYHLWKRWETAIFFFWSCAVTCERNKRPPSSFPDRVLSLAKRMRAPFPIPGGVLSPVKEMRDCPLPFLIMCKNLSRDERVQPWQTLSLDLKYHIEGDVGTDRQRLTSLKLM